MTLSISATIGIAYSDVDFTSNTIYIDRQLKAKNFLYPTFVKWITSAVIVMEHHFTGKAFQMIFINWLVCAGLPPIRWHDLRHMYASVLKNNAVNMKAISEFLGHASPDFTEEVWKLSKIGFLRQLSPKQKIRQRWAEHPQQFQSWNRPKRPQKRENSDCADCTIKGV